MKQLIGQKIIAIRPMDDNELEFEGWEGDPHRPTVIILENRSKLYPSQDPEGNGPGVIFGMDKDKNGFLLG